MTQSTSKVIDFPVPSSADVLDDVLREGARKMLAQAIQAEVDSFVVERKHLVDKNGRRQVVRNGHLPKREIQTPLGGIDVQQPRVWDRPAKEQRETFSSSILPPYLRKTKSLEELIPWLYLKGVSTGGFAEALQACWARMRRDSRPEHHHSTQERLGEGVRGLGGPLSKRQQYV